MKSFLLKCLQKTQKYKNYRYFIFLLAGGLIFSYVIGFPQNILNKKQSLQNDPAVETMSEEVRIEVSQNDLPMTDVVSDNTLKGETGVSENSMDEQAEKEPLKFGEVDDAYFSDAVFIGDSRVVSLYLYSDWKDAVYYCSSGMTLGGVFEDPTGKWKDGNWTVNIADALQREHYKKVYIMLGINDMGVGDLDYFMKHYTAMVNQIHKWQPDAIVYIMSIMSVSAERNVQGDYINNEAIRVRNERLKELDNGFDTFYLDINSVVCDADGCLKAEYTFDGVHLYAQYVPVWTDYLKSHAIVK